MDAGLFRLQFRSITILVRWSGSIRTDQTQPLRSVRGASPHELADEITDRLLSPENAKVTLAQDVRVQVQQTLQGFQIVFPVGEQVRVQRAMHILGEDYFETSGEHDIGHRARRVAGDVDGPPQPASISAVPPGSTMA